MSSTQTFIFLLFVCFSSAQARKLPSYVVPCHRKDPALNSCVRNVIELLRPHLADGIPLLYLPPQNPLKLPEAGLDTNGNFNASFKNIEVYYGPEFKLDYLNMDLDNLRIDFTLSFARLRIKSEYDISGRVLILQLQGHGPADGNFTDVSVTANFTCELKESKGKQYLYITSAKVDMDLGKPVFRFENIFGSNEELNEQTNKIINDNVVDILKELRPVVHKVVLDFGLGIVNRIFTHFSYDQLFPQ